MIRINLAPLEVQENRYWWLPDLAIFSFVLALAYFGVNLLLDESRNELAKLTQEKDNLLQKTAELAPTLKEFESLEREQKDLVWRRDALQAITETKLLRYMPIILMEHVQNLKPEGVWLKRVAVERPLDDGPQPPAAGNAPQQPRGGGATDANDDSKPFEVFISGFAFDHVILAEFMAALKSTAHQEFDAADLRSQVYFDPVNIKETKIYPFPRKVNNQESPVEVIDFQLRIQFHERKQATVEVLDKKVSHLLQRYRKTTGGGRL